MSKRSKHFYEFGDFRLDPVERQLRRNGEVLPLTPKAFEVLVMLVENGGHAIKKGEFLEKVWAGSYVEEKNLADNISLLRKALNDDPKAPAFIETVPRFGYRFMANVREVEDVGTELVVRERESARVVVEEEADAISAAEAGEFEVTARASLPAPAQRRSRPMLIVAALVLAVGLALGAYALRKNRGTGNAPLARSIAVLPFKPLVATNADPALELGITDALISKLSNIRQIVVRPTTSVLKYSAEGQDLRVAGSELGVDVLLDGRVQKVGDRIRVSVQLVRATDGVPMWAEQFDGKFTDIFAVQDEVSRRVVSKLAVQLSGEETRGLARHYTENPEAYRLFLLGRYFWAKMTADGLQEAIRYYSRAIELDPSYALAHAGVADAYNMLGLWDLLPQGEAFPQARAAALRALAIDDTLSESHAALAYAKFRHGWEWQAAEHGFKRAIELNPNYATARQFYAEYLIVCRRFDEASAELEHVRKLDPLSLYVSMQTAIRFYFMRQYDAAIKQLREMIRMDNGYAIAHTLLWACYREKGMHGESVAAQLESLRLNGFNDGELNSLRKAFAASGPRGFWRREIELWKTRPGSLHFSSIFIAMNHAQLGETDEAFAWLEKASAARHSWLTELSADPVWDPLRADTRFARLVERVNIPA